MPNFYDRYQRGSYQEVYDELLGMHEHIYDSLVYEEALSVMREIMKRVRLNIETLVSRLVNMRYQFLKGGSWVNASVQDKIRKATDIDNPAFRVATAKDVKQVTVLEQLTGGVPLSLKCWLEEVGEVDFVGLFQHEERGHGPHLDPLYIYPIDTLVQIVTSFIENDGWQEEPELLLSPDCYHKYGYSGGPAYTMLLPCRTLDAPFLNEPHDTTFVNYLRICMRWGGFPGLEQDNRLSQEKFDFLTKDLIPF